MDIILSIRHLLEEEVVSYFFAGAGTTVFYWIVYFSMLWLGLRYRAASWVAFVPTLLLNFMLQKFWVFGSMEIERGTLELALLVAKYLAIQHVNVRLLHYLIDRRHWSPYWAQPTASVIIAPTSYAISHFIFV